MKKVLFLVILAMLCLETNAQSEAKLPNLNKNAEKPVFNAFLQRCSAREYRGDNIDGGTFSRALLTICGISRHGSDKITVPSVRNADVQVSVLRTDGAYLHDHGKNVLTNVFKKDL